MTYYVKQAIALTDNDDNTIAILDKLNEDNKCKITYQLSPFNEILSISKASKIDTEQGLLKDIYDQYFHNFHEGKISYYISTIKISTLNVTDKSNITYKLIPSDDNSEIIEEIEIADFNI